MWSARFESRSVSEAEAVVSRFFEPHLLSFESVGEISFQFTYLALNATTSLSRLRYGAPAVIRTEHFDRDLMVQMPLSGSNLLSIAEERLLLTQDNYSVLVPGRGLVQHRKADCEMLIVRIRLERIRDYINAYLGFVPHAALTFAQPLQDARDSGRRLRRLASLILEELPGSPSLQPVHSHYEQVLISTLLFEHANSYTEVIDAARGGAVPRYVTKAEEYIRANAGSAITTESLARELNANIRTLQLAFKKFRGCTPMQKIKQIRLELVNRDLRAPEPSATVTDIAMKWGFTHLGSFAQDYRAVFGESPSTTLRRSAGPLPVTGRRLRESG